MRGLIALCLILSACKGEVGTISIGVATAPGSVLLERITRLELEADGQHYTATRDNGGRLALAIEFAPGGTAPLLLRGFDASDALIAVGKSVPLPLSAINAEITIYLAPPLSIAEAPVALPAARAELGTVALRSGAMFAGGIDAAGQVSDELFIYSALAHGLVNVLPLPEPRAQPTLLLGDSGQVYVFGGTDAQGQASASLWGFDARRAPNVTYSDGRSDAALARAGKSAAHLGGERFVVAGNPAVLVQGLTAQPFEGFLTLDGILAAVLSEGVLSILAVGQGVGENGAAQSGGSAFADLLAPASAERTGHAAAATPAGVLTVGGRVSGELTRSALLYEAGVLTERADFLATPREAAAVAATSQYLVVAGGKDALGQPIGNVEVFDAKTLEPVATLPLLVARSGAVAIPLATDQILIAAGRDVNDQPTATLELFTPP